MARKNIIEIITSLLVLLFVYAAGSKLFSFTDSLVRLKTSPFIGPFAPYLVLLIPGAEILIATLLLMRSMRLTGFYLSLCLLTAFTIYIIAVLNFSPRVPCSCGGVIQWLSWKEHIVFNLIFISLAGTGIVLQRKYYKGTTLSGEAENLY